MNKQNSLLKTLLVVAGLLAGVNGAWADVYTNDSYRYDVVFGTPTYDNEVLTGIDVQTDFTTDYTSQEFSTMTLVMTGTVLSGNQPNGRSYSFGQPQTVGTVTFKAVGKFNGGNYTFFNIYGVKEEGGATTDNYAVVQSPTSLPSGSGETIVLRIFGQDIKASYVYTPRSVAYGFDVTIDLENQKVNYTVTYASKGSSGTVSQLSTVTGSVNVPDGVTLKSVKSFNLPRVGQSGGNTYDNVAFYSTSPATTYTINYKDENDVLLKSVECNSYAGLSATASAEQLANFTKDDTEYTYKSGNETITLSTTAASNVINLVFKAATEETTYTIKYLDENQNVIKTAYVGNAYTGDVVTASGENLPTYIWSEDVKYKYSTGNKNITLVANAEDNIIELIYAEAAKYNYTIKASIGQTILSESAYENETVYYHYPQVLQSGTTLYTTTTDNTGVDGNGYKSKLLLDSDNKEVTKNYTAGNITNLLFLAEGEDIFTKGTGVSADTRLSMGAGGYASEKTAIFTLPAGSYTLCGVNRGNGSGHENHKFYKGDELFFTTTPQGYNVSFSESFTLTSTTTIYMQGGGNTRLIDYVYIYGTPTNDIVGAYDYSTGFMGDHTDMTISMGQTVKFVFNNHGNGVSNWFNWLLRLSGTSGVDHTLRADNYVIGDGESTVSTRSITEDGGAINWDDFLEDMKDASVEMTINYTNAGMFSVAATSTGANHTYSHSFAYNAATSGDILLELGVEKAWLEVISAEQLVTGTIAQSGYSSLASAYGLDFANATGLTDAFVVTKTTDDAVTLTSVDELPANSGVILKGEAGAAYSIPVKADAAYAGTNLLSAAVAPTIVQNDEAYILKGGKFALISGAATEAARTIPAGKAYLLKSNVPSGARSLSFVYNNDETTGISGATRLTDNGESVKDNVYNLNGQRVSQPTKGLYIVNGKKVIIK